MRKLYKYYMTQRPPAPGALPGYGLFIIRYLNTEENRQFVPEINREAYAVLLYERKLTEQEMKEYELVAKP